MRAMSGQEKVAALLGIAVIIGIVAIAGVRIWGADPPEYLSQIVGAIGVGLVGYIGGSRPGPGEPRPIEPIHGTFEAGPHSPAPVAPTPAPAAPAPTGTAVPAPAPAPTPAPTFPAPPTVYPGMPGAAAGQVTPVTGPSRHAGAYNSQRY